MTEIFHSTELRRELHPLAELGLKRQKHRAVRSPVTRKNRR